MKEVITMDSPIISIIIPVYNASSYIKEALDSVVHQSLKNIEIIAINDCSTDESLNILKEYSEEYNNIRIFSTSKNSGSPGIPKNIGINNAKGEYVMFMDNDDIYAEDACEVLYDIAQKTNSDVIMGNAVLYPSKAPLRSWKSVFRGTRARLNIKKNRELIYVMTNWAKLFKRGFLIEHNINFHDFNYFDDQLFMIQCYFKSNHISLTSKVVYYWRDRSFYEDHSLSQSKISYRNLDHILEMNYLVDKFYQDNNLQLYKRNKDIRAINHSLNLFLKNVRHGDDEYKDYFFEKMSKYLQTINIPYENISDPRYRFRYYCLQKGLKDVFFESISIEKGLTLNQLPRKYVNDVEYLNFLGNKFETTDIPFYLAECQYKPQTLVAVEGYQLQNYNVNIFGYSFIRYFEIKNSKDIEKNILLTDMDNNQVFQKRIKNVMRKDRTIVFQRDSINYDYSGFDFNLDINSINKYIKKNRQYKLQISQKLYEKKEFLNGAIGKSWVNRNEVLLHCNSRDGSIFCLYSNANRELIIISFSNSITFKIFQKKISFNKNKMDIYMIKRVLKKLHLFNMLKKIYRSFIK